MFTQEALQQISVNTHSSICIRGEKVIYIDPIRIPDEPHDADMILITHPHFDHFSPKDIKKLVKQNTVIVVPESMTMLCRLRTRLKPVPVLPGQDLEFGGIRIEAVAAYNRTKLSHLQSRRWVGYVLTLGETRVYITGDTDDTDECRTVNCDILMVPIGGRFTVDAAEAAEMVNQIKPHTVIPIHYGMFLGGAKAPDYFRKLLDESISADIRNTVYNNLMLFQYIRIVLLALCCGLLGWLIGHFI